MPCAPFSVLGTSFQNLQDLPPSATSSVLLPKLRYVAHPPALPAFSIQRSCSVGWEKCTDTRLCDRVLSWVSIAVSGQVEPKLHPLLELQPATWALLTAMLKGRVSPSTTRTWPPSTWRLQPSREFSRLCNTPRGTSCLQTAYHVLMVCSFLHVLWSGITWSSCEASLSLISACEIQMGWQAATVPPPASTHWPTETVPVWGLQLLQSLFKLQWVRNPLPQ